MALRSIEPALLCLALCGVDPDRRGLTLVLPWVQVTAVHGGWAVESDDDVSIVTSVGDLMCAIEGVVDDVLLRAFTPSVEVHDDAILGGDWLDPRDDEGARVVGHADSRTGRGASAASPAPGGASGVP